jgi:glycosyltransferase involved in cell wall biosynthesis
VKIIITGMPYFAKKLHQQLKRYDKKNTYIYLNTFYKKLDKFKFLWNIFTTDIVFMHGGSIEGSNVIDLTLFLKKKMIIVWAGSDVINEIEKFNNNKYKSSYIDKVCHLCETEWIKEELKVMGVDAKIQATMIYHKKKTNLKKLSFPDKFSVLTYISKDRPKFYGIDIVVKLANDFPNIEFKIAGLQEYDDLPSNITLLGWVDMNKEYQKCVVYIRTPSHDGLGFSVIEALSYGRVVFRNYDFSYVNYFEGYEDLKNQFQKTIDSFNDKKLKLNVDGMSFVRKEFSEKKVLGNLIEIFEGILRR